MRGKFFIRSSWGVIGLALAGLFGTVASAEDAACDWFRQDATWKSHALPVGDLFQLRLDGRSFVATKKSAGSSTTATPPKDDKEASGPSITFTFDGKPVSVKREMLLDPARQAIRILDVFSNAEDSERKVRVDYSTTLGERGGVRYNGVLMPDGSARDYGQSVPEDAPGAIVLAERDGSDAVPLFLWGQSDARWRGKIRDIGSTVNLSYEGVIPAGGKIALLHWVATAGLERGVRLEQGFEKFFKGGHLVQPLVPAEVVPLVVNFPAGAFQQETAPVAVSTTAHRLVLLDDLCARLKIKREAKDVLALGGDQRLVGDATVEKLSMISRGKTLEPALAEVAAISGGAGVGRLHRLYLRNGSVLSGQVSLAGASLETSSGRVMLAAAAVELLLLRVQPQDGEWPPNVAGYVQTQQGELFWLTQAPAAVELAASFGGITLPVWQVERHRDPAVSLTVLLEDGSRIQGVAVKNVMPFEVQGRGQLNLSGGELTRWGNADAVEKVAPDGEPVKLLADRHCTLRDGSVLAGTLTNETLRLTTATGETTVKVDELMRLDCKSPDDTTVELVSGAKLKGALLDEVLHWKREQQAISIPVGLVTELMKKAGTAAITQTPEAASAGAPVASPKE